MKKIDYKGKYFMIQDELDDEGMDFEIGEISAEEITDKFLADHVLQCIYYGIPPYMGKNEELKSRIDNLYKKYEENN